MKLMTMTPDIAQLRISRELAEAETSLNDALLKQAQLMATMVAARQGSGGSVSLGQDALMRLVKSQQTLLSAGGDLARVHNRLLEIGQSMDLVHAMDDCPEGAPTTPRGIVENLRNAA